MFKYPDLPKINTGPPASLTTIEGNNASLPCSASGIPKPTITWYKNGEALDSANYDADSGMLTLNNIQFADQGVYKCEARNFLGFDSATVELFLQGRYYLIEAIILAKRRGGSVHGESLVLFWYVNLTILLFFCCCCCCCCIYAVPISKQRTVVN